MSSVLQWYTDWTLSVADGDEILAFVISTQLAHAVLFFGLNILLSYAYRNNWWAKYRIRSELPPDSLVRKAWLLAVSGHLMNLPIQYYIFGPLFAWRGWQLSGDIPDLITMAKQIVLFYFVEDFCFYWTHRTLHHRSIYKYIHKVHHEYKYSVGIAAEYAHPVESFVGNLVPTMLGPFFVQGHVITLSIWFVIRISEAINGHCGYELPFSPWEMLPFQGGSARHYYHHSHNVGSYGSFTQIWDYLMGTDVHFKTHQAKLKEAKAAKQVE